MKISYCNYCKKELIYTGYRPKNWCNDSCRNKYRYENNIKYKQRNTYEEQAKRAKIRKLKAIEIMGGSCIRCGQSHPAALCFHHIDPSTKSFAIDGRVFGNIKWSAIEAELLKCQLLCQNCHLIEHNGFYWDSFA